MAGTFVRAPLVAVAAAGGVIGSAAAFGGPDAAGPVADGAGAPRLAVTAADVASGTASGWYVVTERRSRAGSFVDLDALLGDSVVTTRGLFGGGDRGPDGRTRYVLIRLADGVEADGVRAALSARPGLTLEPVVVGESTARRSGDDDDSRPNDPAFRLQYALENVGQTIDGQTGLPGADIRVVDAWTRQTGSPEVVIAVIDAGVASSHPDLADKLVAGHNVVGPDHNDTDAPFNAHGTEVAGVAAASSNNGEGLTGVSWGSSIMPVTAANIVGFTSDVWLAEGLVWAADAGADVAVISFGLNAPTTVLADAVSYAASRGVLVISSAGNTGQDGVLYPAAYPEAMAIGATNSRDELATFSTRGEELELVAPGVSILTTTHTVQDPDTYAFASGTSISAPIVAGVAALIKSADPLLSGAEIREILLETAVDLGEPGWDPGFGFGRVDATAALDAVLAPRSCPVDVNRDGRVDSADFFAWLLAFDLGSVRADLNGDGQIEAGDFFAFVQAWGAGARCPSEDGAGSNL